MAQPNGPDRPPDDTSAVSPQNPGAQHPQDGGPPPRGGGHPPHDAGQPPESSSYLHLRASMVARLLLVGPLAVGTLLAEGVFAARGDEADAVSLPAAALAWLLLWAGIAYALHSWVAILLTFVPAAMMTLGAAMVGDLAPGAGIALLIVGGTLLLAIIWARLIDPTRRWTPGWSAPPSTPGADSAGVPTGSGDQHSGNTGGAVSEARPDRGASGMPGRPPGYDDMPGLAPSSPRRPPAWDTSATDTAARDALVLQLCQRGGTTGPTLVTLEDFFTGNGDPRSIAPGLRGEVPLSRFATVLHRLRSRRDVSEVAVQVEPLEPGEYPAGEWPVAGSVQVLGTASADDIEAAVAGLRAESVLGPLPVEALPDGRPAPDGSAEYALWWA